VLAWNKFRRFGPVLRFAPSTASIRAPDRAIWYAASSTGAPLAEAFQVDRTIDRRHGPPYLTGLSFTSLTVLDLAVDSEGAWAARAGGTFAISTAAHAITQQWARAIVDEFPDLEGVHYNSRFAEDPCVPLTHPDVGRRLAAAARVSATASSDRRPTDNAHVPRSDDR
jgi:RES domain